MTASYQSIEKELAQHKTAVGTPDWDVVRRQKLKDLEAHTKRVVLVYAVDFLNSEKVRAAGQDIQIQFSDKDGFFEITNKLADEAVDVILHSPGGLPEAAESLVAMLRNKFKHVRFIIPNIAKSAATMMAMSGNEVLMDANAELGPVDPQLVFRKGDNTVVQAPAQAIVDQFEEAQQLIGADPTKLPAWLPILQQYGPSLYKEAKNALDLAPKLVEEWLTKYMFGGDANGPKKAAEIAKYLGDHNEFKSHGRRVGRKALQDRGATIVNLENDPDLHDRVLAVYFAIVHTFNGATFKMFENSRGDGLYRGVQSIQIPVQMQPGFPLPGLKVPQPKQAQFPPGQQPPPPAQA